MTGRLGGLLDADGEVVVRLADGWTLRSGVYDPNDPAALTSGEYVRLVDPQGDEYAYWDQDEWATDPALVMGAIVNAAAGLRLERSPRRVSVRSRRVEHRARTEHAALVGALIKATSAVCSDGQSFVDDLDFPEPITLRITDDTNDLFRWMDDDHMDPWYFVELVEAPLASRAVLDEAGAHVVAVYGPSYRLDGSYEKPAWRLVCPPSDPSAGR